MKEEDILTIPVLEVCTDQIFQTGLGLAHMATISDPARSKEKNFRPGPSPAWKRNWNLGPSPAQSEREIEILALPIFFLILAQTAWFKWF